MVLWIRIYISDVKYKLNKFVLFVEYGKLDRILGYNFSNWYNDMVDMFNVVYVLVRSGGLVVGVMVWYFVFKFLKYNFVDGYGIVILENLVIVMFMYC